MKNIIEILDRRYQSFIKQKEDWNFFVLLADYMQYILNTPETKEILDSLIEESDDSKIEKIEYKEDDIELWMSLDKLILVYLTILKFDELEKELSKVSRKNKVFKKKHFELWGAMFEMEEIKNRQKISQPKTEEDFQFYRNNYEIYATRLHNYLIQELSKKEDEKAIKKQVKETTLYLNQNGDLYRKPKTKYCYSMGEESCRYKIIKFLAQNRGYQSTQLIADRAGNKNKQTTRTEIGKIRNNIEKYLKIDGKDFLQGKKESGYRINPKYKITFKNE